MVSMDIMLVFQQMLVMLLLLICGVIAAKTNVMDEDTTRRFTRFTLVFPQTCMILGSVINTDLGISPGRVFAVLGVGCLMYVILIGLSFLVPVVYRCKPGDRGIYSFMTIFGNVGFMGIPVAGAIFGDAGTFYAALLNIPFNLLAYTFGISLLNSTGGPVKIKWRLLLNPPLIASGLAIVLICLNIRFPYPVERAVTLLGDMVTPSSMIIIGASLGTQKLKDVFGDWHTYAFAPVRLIVCPVLIYFVMRLFVHDSVILGVMTLLASMPVATFATMLSIEYGGNEKMASRTVFVTTVLSVLTIPLVFAILPL